MSELVCGPIIRRDLPRDELIISSKAGYSMWPGPHGDWLSKKYIVASCDQSLKRMGLDYFDIFYLHRTDPETPLEESLGALDLLIRQGKVLYAGVSNFSGAHFADAVRMGRVQAAQGAALIDLGAESSNARAARVSVADQIATLVPAVKELAAEAVVSLDLVDLGCWATGEWS